MTVTWNEGVLQKLRLLTVDKKQQFWEEKRPCGVRCARPALAQVPSGIEADPRDPRTFDVAATTRRNGVGVGGTCSEAAKLDRFWVEFSAVIPRLGGAESDEGFAV